MADEQDPESPSGEEEQQEESGAEGEETPAGQDSEKSEGEESDKPEKKAVPLKRFQQVYGELKQYREGYQSLQQELQDLRSQLAAAAKGKQSEASEDSEEKPLTPQQIKAIDRVLRQSHPKLFQTIERMEADFENSENAMIARAERDITKLAGEANFATDEESLATIAEMVGNRIREDPSLAAMWRARDPLCLELAFKKVEKQLQAFQRKANGQMLKNGKKLAKLPTAPVGGTTTSTPKPQNKPKEKGITKATHDDAWEVLQAHMQQS